jgi:putative DNA methylase
MYKKKLIEVALPLATINREAAREKSIRHGHPSTLHLWWARRPLAAARAVLWASLVDDPSAHPEQFPTEDAQRIERERLFDILERLVPWEASNDERILDEARAEIVKSCDGDLPKILDPFGGGGAIPLESLRLGLPTYTGDLNPVAVLIHRAMLEIPARFAGLPPVHPTARAESSVWEGARGLAADVAAYGEWMRDEAKARIGQYYPDATLPDGSKATPIAWIWARTVESPDPSWPGPVPLVRSWVLAKKPGKPVV